MWIYFRKWSRYKYITQKELQYTKEEENIKEMILKEITSSHAVIL